MVKNHCEISLSIQLRLGMSSLARETVSNNERKDFANEQPSLVDTTTATSSFDLLGSFPSSSVDDFHMDIPFTSRQTFFPAKSSRSPEVMRRFDTLPEEREEDLMESSVEFSREGAAPLKTDDDADDTLMEDDGDDDDKPFLRDESTSGELLSTSATEEREVASASPTLSPIFTSEEISHRFSSSMLFEDFSEKVTITSEFSQTRSPTRPIDLPRVSFDTTSPTAPRSNRVGKVKNFSVFF